MDRTTRTRRRSLRDWLVDITLFLFAVTFGLVLTIWRVESAEMPDPAWLFDLDQVAGVLGCAALWLRRRWPVGLAAALVAATTFSELIGGAVLVALFTVAVHRGPRPALGVYTGAVSATTVFGLIRPEPGLTIAGLLFFGVVFYGAPIGWGLFVHHRRQLILSLKDRAARAETEAHLRAEQAQLHAREAIAREMHDVLGHRLSLLSVHAGALEFRPDAPPDDIARAAKIVRESAHQALQDLREVIGVLRAPVAELPQPTLADIPHLVAEARRAGTTVHLVEDRAAAVPESIGRTAYRIVQEALTNARKHAPGSEVHVRVAGAPGEGLTVEVRNTPPAAPATADTTGGQGLAGLAERVALAGGRLAHGTAADTGWRVSSWLPWPP